MACFDSDRDGDLDLFITNNEPANSIVFYRNDLNNGNNYLTVKLTSDSLNNHGIGALIEIHDETGKLKLVIILFHKILLKPISV